MARFHHGKGLPEDMIKRTLALVEKLLRDRNNDLTVSYSIGTETYTDDGIVAKHRPNGTATFTIEVNGGKRDTTADPLSSFLESGIIVVRQDRT